MDDHIDYQTISFVGSWAGMWVALICGAIALTLILVGVVRVRRHRAYSARENRNVDPNMLHDTAVQRRVGYGFAAVAAVGLAVGVVLYFKDQAAIVHNVKAKYPEVVEVADVKQTGMSYTADITRADGTTSDDELIMVEPTGEPRIGDDILGEPGLGGM